MEEEDILEKVESGLPYVMEPSGHVKTVTAEYQLEKGEKYVKEKEYLIYNAEALLKQLKKGEELVKQAKKIQRFKLRIDNYNHNVRHFHKQQPFFFDKARIFWWWNAPGHYYEVVDETQLMVSLDEIIGLDGQAVTRSVKANYLEAFRQVGRKMIPKNAKVKWVQFRDKAYSVFSNKVHDVRPNYFFTNPIPWEMGESTDTPVLDRLFSEWVPEYNIQTLYEIIAYCCYRDYPIHRIFCFVGAGRNGKSTFLRILSRFLGTSNTCASELDALLDRRFESFKLYKKLLCTLGETNFNVLKNTSLLKKLVGQDMIGFEKKQCDPFDDFNYAKVVIASNSLPSTQDTSEGFFRRWLIIDFPNTFKEGRDILKEIPDQEYRNLARKCTEILPALLKGGEFTAEGTIEDKTRKYILESNPLSIFIEKYCETGEDYYCSYAEFSSKYHQYLKAKKKRRVMSKEIKNALEEEGYWMERTSKEMGVSDQGYPKYKSAWWITGIKLKENMSFMSKNSNISLLSPIGGKEVENRSFSTYRTYENVYHNCAVEGCQGFVCKLDSKGVPYCEKHYEEMAV